MKTPNLTKHRILTGMLIVIPFLAIVFFLEKVWHKFKGVSEKVGEALGIDSFLGSYTVTIVFLILILSLFYFVGTFAQKKLIKDFQNSLDTSILQFVPGYLNYKNKMHESLDKESNLRKPVFIIEGDEKLPGILIEQNDKETVVYIPGIPDTNNGELVIVSNDLIENTDFKYLEFLKSLQLSGKGLLNN